jgi:hypothetical protein
MKAALRPRSMDLVFRSGDVNADHPNGKAGALLQTLPKQEILKKQGAHEKFLRSGELTLIIDGTMHLV